MNVTELLGPLLSDVATSVGLAASDGDLNGGWFDSPLGHLESILSDPTQRAALLDVLNQIAPPEAVPSVPDSEKWHPLLGQQTKGNLYLIVDDSADPVITLGVGGAYLAGAASARFSMPVMSFSASTVDAVAGTAQGPLQLALAIPLGWTRPTQSIGLAGIEVSLSLAPLPPPEFALSLVLRGLDLDGTGPVDMTIDPSSLGRETAHVLVGLVKQSLSAAASGATGEAKLLADHLLPVLGLDGTGPLLPITELASNPHAIMTWLAAMTTGSPAPVSAWLGHLAALLGVTAPAVTATSATGSFSYSVPLFEPAPGSSVSLVLTSEKAADGVTPVLAFGVAVSLAPSATAGASFDGRITICELPLAGSTRASMFPSAELTIAATGGSGSALVTPGASGFGVASLRAGILWNGRKLGALVELIDIELDGTSYPVIDLTNANSVVAAASGALSGAISSALGGSGAGRSIAALVGLVEPFADATAPLINFAQLASHPTAAIAALHREALVSSAHPWSNYFGELLDLIGVAGPSHGTGTPSDPWAATIDSIGPLALELVAWNAQLSGVAGDLQKLRIGMRVAASAAPVMAAFTVELLGVDLPASGPNTVALIGGMHLAVDLTPSTQVGGEGVSVAASSFAASLDVAVGSAPVASATISGLTVALGTQTVSIPTLSLPLPSSFDVTNPAASLGIATADLEQLVLALASHELGSLLELTSGWGLPADFPSLASAGTAGQLFTDPFGAIIAWLGSIASGLSADGSSFAGSLIGLVSSLLAGVTNGSPTGSGTYDDPWLMPISSGDSTTSGLAWLEPAGPPVARETLIAGLGSSADFDSLVAALVAAAPAVPKLPPGVDVGALSSGLQSLADYLADSDGVVPTASQTPAGWTVGTPVVAAHHLLAAAPAAITQTISQVDAWVAPGSSRAILLLGPAFLDHSEWVALLAQAESEHAGTTSAEATFSLRVPGVAAASVDLRGVTTVTDYYTADLQDDGTGDITGLAAQIGLIAARIAALKPGAPLIVVAHSTAGVAARAYVAGTPAGVAGLITIGSPHGGAPLTPLVDPFAADSVLLFRDLFVGGVAGGPLNDALGHLAGAVDGYLPSPTVGGLPVAAPYPVGSFAGSVDSSTGGVATLAVPGTLGSPSLLYSIAAAATALVTAQASAAPTHVAFGMLASLDLGADQTVTADASLRFDLGRVALVSDATDPVRPAEALTFSCSLQSPGGWLAGGARSFAGVGAAPITVRARSLELGAVVAMQGSARTVTPFATVWDAAFHSAIRSAAWADPDFEAVLGAAVSSIAAPIPSATSSLGAMLSALQTLGIVVADASAPPPGGGLGISADAITSLGVDAAGFLAPRLAAAVSAGGFLGFTSTGGDLVLPVGPFELFASVSPAVVGIRTPGTSPAFLLGGEIGASFSAELALSGLAATVAAKLGELTIGVHGGVLSVGAPPLVAPVELFPSPSGSAIATALSTAVGEFIASTAASALIESVMPAGFEVHGLLQFLASPGSWLVQTDALGNGTVLDPAKLSHLFSLFGVLPAGIALTATGSSPTTIQLATGAPIGGILGLDFGVVVDETRHLAPSGTITLSTPLSGTWPTVGITFGVSPAGIVLSVTPGGASPIQLLPTFSGAGALGGAALTLLPAALDGLLEAIAPTPPLAALVLDVASALDLYDSVGGFAAHATEFTALTGPTWFESLESSAKNAFVSAVVSLFNDASSPLHDALPGTFAFTGSMVNWSYPLGAGFTSGSLALAVGWDVTGPSVSFGAQNVEFADAPIVLTVSTGFAGGSLAVAADVGVDLSSALGISVKPVFSWTSTGGMISLALLPLGVGTGSTLGIQLLPTVDITSNSTAVVQLIEDWAMPLTASLVLDIPGIAAHLNANLWSSGTTRKTAAGILEAMGVLRAAGTASGFELASPLPAVQQLMAGALQAVAGVSVPLVNSPPLTIEIASDTSTPSVGKLGIKLKGKIDLVDGDPTIALLFGPPDDWQGAPSGVTLWLFTFPSSGDPVFTPGLGISGLGVGLSGDGDAPLINSSGVRIGGIDAVIFADLDFTSTVAAQFGGGIEITKLGLPLSSLDSSSSSNPVAASVLDSNGGDAGGDTAAANPAVNVSAYVLPGQAFTLILGGTNNPIVIPVHATFGPLYLDQLEIAVTAGNVVELGVDGSLTMAGLTIGVIDLALAIPVKSVLKPSDWSLDLQGLAVGFSEAPIEISGGLRKNPGPPIEYDGMLSVTIADLGLTIVGAYSRPSDADGSYTSLWMFVSLPFPLGGPPMAFVTGLGGGFGYNRELNVPTDLNDIDSFVLVAAVDGDGLSNDPMTALVQMGKQIPSRRGSFWIAAGVRFTTFALVQSTVIVTIALDRGFEIDILGISRMALPTEDAALVSVELALKARFNSEEGILSIQAQLTDNSYLFSRDCQLTGGFAFFVWYKEGQFVLTLGGYNPVFSPPPDFPAVPRLGFNWSVSDAIVIKGGAYFALTNSCVMAGGALSATANIGPVKAWFEAYVDFLISWDPFHYEFDIGVEIGASFTMTICFFGCVDISMSISVGATLMIEGPPFHGTASIDAYITTITVSFGDDAIDPVYITDFGVFAGKYVTSGSPDQTAVSLAFSKGVLAQDPPGAPPLPGTASQPYQVGIEFSIQTTTRMPATTSGVSGTSLTTVELNSIDIAPMYKTATPSDHTLKFEQLTKTGWGPVVIKAANSNAVPTVGFFPEATWHWVDPNNIPAAARTIAAISGLTLDAFVSWDEISALISISSLVTDIAAYALPLPLDTTNAISATFQSYGQRGAQMASAIASASSTAMLRAAETVLSGQNAFSEGREVVGLPPTGLAPLATHALLTQRSAPPVVGSITRGLTMLPVGLAAPTVVSPVAPVLSVVLDAPRLRATLQRKPSPIATTEPAQHTTVTGSGAPRMTAPTPVALASARLILVADPTAARPTTAALPSRSLRNADFGSPVGSGHQQALEAASADLLATGVTLGAGSAHIWDLHLDGGTFALGGDAAARIVFADRTGTALTDVELIAAGSAPIAVPSGAALAIVDSLGTAPTGLAIAAPAFGAVTLASAPSGSGAAVGWATTSTLWQVGPAELLGRGSRVTLAKPFSSTSDGQRASYGATLAALALAGQPGVQTQLPAGVDVVMIVIDCIDPTLAVDTDLAIGVTGGTLATSPSRVTTGSRRVLLYDVESRDAGATILTVAVASSSTWSLGGVIGVRGMAAEWAQTLSGGLPDHFVPEGPLSPGGTLTVAFTPGGSL